MSAQSTRYALNALQMSFESKLAYIGDFVETHKVTVNSRKGGVPTFETMRNYEAYFRTIEAANIGSVGRVFSDSEKRDAKPASPMYFADENKFYSAQLNIDSVYNMMHEHLTFLNNYFNAELNDLRVSAENHECKLFQSNAEVLIVEDEVILEEIAFLFAFMIGAYYDEQFTKDESAEDHQKATLDVFNHHAPHLFARLDVSIAIVNDNQPMLPKQPMRPKRPMLPLEVSRSVGASDDIINHNFKVLFRNFFYIKGGQCKLHARDRENMALCPFFARSQKY